MAAPKPELPPNTLISNDHLLSKSPGKLPVMIATLPANLPAYAQSTIGYICIRSKSIPAVIPSGVVSNRVHHLVSIDSFLSYCMASYSPNPTFHPMQYRSTTRIVPISMSQQAINSALWTPSILLSCQVFRLRSSKEVFEENIRIVFRLDRIFGLIAVSTRQTIG